MSNSLRCNIAISGYLFGERDLHVYVQNINYRKCESLLVAVAWVRLGMEVTPSRRYQKRLRK